jgi:pimeloyl-ACP methyl ester carboxylesterase
MGPLPAGVEHHYAPYGRHGAVTSYYCCLPPPNAPCRGALLFISGFGVGGWHYERNLPALAAEGYACFAPDLLGQGRSWPQALGGEQGGALSSDSYDDDGGDHINGRARRPPVLRYSVDEWVEQLRRFVEEVVLPRTGGKRRVVVAGNSLGGYLAVQMAARCQHLVRGVVLLNATPFWAFQQRTRKTKGGRNDGDEENEEEEEENDAASGLAWPPPAFDGRVPAPTFLTRAIERLWWDQLRRPETVESLLGQVYSNPKAFASDTLTAPRILEATDHPGAVDAFVSIALSPKPQVDFDDALVSPPARRAPLLLLYGAQDPWVHPYWARRARRQRPDAPLWLIQGAGHCPAHEAPTAVNACLARWLSWLEHGGGFVGGGGGGGAGGEQAAAEGEAAAPPPPPPVPLAVGEEWRFDGASTFFEGEGATVVRSDPGEPTTLMGKLERLVVGRV